MREERKLSQADLAKRAGVSQGMIDKLERGETKRTMYAAELATALGVTIGALIDTEGKPLAELPILEAIAVGDRRLTDTLPIKAPMAGETADAQGFTNFSSNPVDVLGRPDFLTKDCYCLYMPTEQMAPAYRAGDILLVNPHLPVRLDDDVVVWKKVEGGCCLMAATLIGATTEWWTLQQYNPSRQVRVDRNEFPRCEVIVGKVGRR